VAVGGGGGGERINLSQVTGIRGFRFEEDCSKSLHALRHKASADSKQGFCHLGGQNAGQREPERLQNRAVFGIDFGIDFGCVLGTPKS